MTDPAKNHGLILTIWGGIVTQWQWLASHWPTLNEWVLITTTMAGALSCAVSLTRLWREGKSGRAK